MNSFGLSASRVSKTENIRFVEVVENYPILYDFNMQKKYGKSARTEAWNKVALEVNDNPSSCKERWQRIRTNLLRYLKTDSKRGFYLFEHMQFLIPFLTIKSNDEKGPDLESFQEISSTQMNNSKNYDNTNSKSKKRNSSELMNGDSNFKKLAKSSLYCEDEAVCDEEDNSDVLFFKSILADVKKMSRTQKYQFRINVLNTLHNVLQSS